MNTVEDQNDDPFVSAKLQQITTVTGEPFATIFELNKLSQLSYLHYKYFDFDNDLSFLKYCTNLEEIDFCCCNVVQDITNLKFLKNLKKLLISDSKINSIESLSDLTQLETISLSGCEIESLVPFLQHKKIKQINLGLISNEDEILQIISNQKSCNASYLIKSNFEIFDTENTIFYVSIHLKEDSLSIDIEAISDLKYKKHCEILPQQIDNDEKINSYYEWANLELNKRIKTILNSDYPKTEAIVFCSREEISFGTKIDFN